MTGPRRSPAEREMLAMIREDSWRFDNPGIIERIYLDAIIGEEFTPFELNVLYEILALAPNVRVLLEFTEREYEGVSKWVDRGLGVLSRYTEEARRESTNVGDIPFALMLAARALAGDHLLPNPPASWQDREGDPVEAHLLARECVGTWRQNTNSIRKQWREFGGAEGLLLLMEQSFLAVRDEPNRDVSRATHTMLGVACEVLMRVGWLFECEDRDALVFGPASDRRLPADQAKATRMLRRFAEQQPELRKTPSFEHVMPKDPEDLLRPRVYADMAHAMALVADPEQTAAVVSDALENRRFIHDHLAVIEVDHRPIKWVALAPEFFDQARGCYYLSALVAHERGTFACEVILGTAEQMTLALPFGSYAWRGARDADERRRAGGDQSLLPPDDAIIALIIAAWRDLIVANVRVEQYEQKVQREGAKPERDGKVSPRKAQRNPRVVRYLPRTVVIRRAAEHERAEAGVTSRNLSRPYRVGTFARTLQEGHQRSRDAQEFAEEIGIPLRDTQTVVRPHIRGGTEAERLAMLAQDDVRLWRSWAAVDLLFATRKSNS